MSWKFEKILLIMREMESFNEFKKEVLRNKEVKKEYDRLRPWYENIVRNKRKRKKDKRDIIGK